MTLEENRATWAVHDWSAHGEEWSSWWGTSAQQWKVSIFPRIEKYLPAQKILEIGMGCGRWTKFLLQHCERLVGLDITPECVDVCRARFAQTWKCWFAVNDGKSLEHLNEELVDFAFSFDSLPHADESVIAAYLEQLALKLEPNGTGFIHHSNAGACKIGGGLRDPNMTAAKFPEHCSRVGLACVSQELVDWCSDELTDCFSIISRGPVRQPSVIENHHFREEMGRAKALSALAV